MGSDETTHTRTPKREPGEIAGGVRMVQERTGNKAVGVRSAMSHRAYSEVRYGVDETTHAGTPRGPGSKEKGGIEGEVSC